MWRIIVRNGAHPLMGQDRGRLTSKFGKLRQTVRAPSTKSYGHLENKIERVILLQYDKTLLKPLI